jgi:hypothetical protein
MAIEDKDQENKPHLKNKNNDYQERVGMGNHPDPSAKRNIGPGGAQERPGQKDKLENLHIGGNETTGYGANDSTDIESFAQGPGYEFEGSDTAMDDDVNGIRTRQQPLGSDSTEKDESDHSRR